MYVGLKEMNTNPVDQKKIELLVLIKAWFRGYLSIEMDLAVM